MPEVVPVCRLRDGALVRVRHVRPSDEGALRAAFRELSVHSRYQRFLGPVSELSDSLWHYLCNPDGGDHVALVALADDLRVVGVARFIRLSTEPTTAELAVTIADAWQRRGLGSVLFEQLVDAARRRGIVSFVALALSNNVAIRRLMARQGHLDFRATGGERLLFLRLRDRPAA